MVWTITKWKRNQLLLRRMPWKHRKGHPEKPLLHERLQSWFMSLGYLGFMNVYILYIIYYIYIYILLHIYIYIYIYTYILYYNILYRIYLLIIKNGHRKSMAVGFSIDLWAGVRCQGTASAAFGTLVMCRSFLVDRHHMELLKMPSYCCRSHMASYRSTSRKVILFVWLFCLFVFDYLIMKLIGFYCQSLVHIKSSAGYPKDRMRPFLKQPSICLAWNPS